MPRLLRLLEMDIEAPGNEPQTWDGLVAECARCVDPIKQQFPIAGSACEAAMLTKLWRDVRVDAIRNGRVYLPRDLAAQHGLDLSLMRKALSLDTQRGIDGDQRNSNCNCLNGPGGGLLAVLPAYRKMMCELVGRTGQLLTISNGQPQELPTDQRALCRRMIYESQATLRMIARNRYDTLTRRPRLSAVSRAWIGLRLRLPG